MLSHDNSYLAAYKERLLKNREAAQAKKTEEKKPLRDQIAEWFENLQPSEKHAAFSMAFFVKRFGRPPSELGPVLSEQLNWTRVRKWQGQGPYRRMWIADNTKIITTNNKGDL